MDFVPTNEILVFNKTTLRECVNLDIIEDAIYEGDEDFPVSLTPADPVSANIPFNIVLQPRIGVVIIMDNDGTQLTNL